MSHATARKIGLAVVVLAATQAALFVGYRALNAKQEQEQEQSTVTSKAGAHTLELVAVPTELAAAPPLVVDARGVDQVFALTRPTLVHFWATWCEPCRAELPALLALADDDELGVAVVAVSVDESWDVIDHYFDGNTPASIARASRATAAAYAASPLPVSFLVDGTGRLRFRLPGSQPWQTDTVRAWLKAASASASAQ